MRGERTNEKLVQGVEPYAIQAQVQTMNRFSDNAAKRTAAPTLMSIEGEVVQMFKEALRVKNVSLQDNFFSLGGDSIAATQIVLKIEESFRVSVTLPEFYAAQSIEALAMRIYEKQANQTNKHEGDTEEGVL